MLTTLNVLGLDQGRIYSEAEMQQRFGQSGDPPADAEAEPRRPLLAAVLRRLLHPHGVRKARGDALPAQAAER
jgi:hypothetical protein